MVIHATESQSESADAQHERPGELYCNGKEPRPRRWITTEEWNSYIENNPDFGRRSSSVVSIFRVPNILTRGSQKREAYVPTRVSLGPYHHGSAELSPMNSHKGRALHRAMTRFNKNLLNDPNNMDFCNRAKEEIVRLESQIRDSYEEKIDCNTETLAMMLSLDGCFLLEVLRTRSQRRRQASECYEPIFERDKISHAGTDILYDILKLENQIPLIVLRKLIELERDDVERGLHRQLLVQVPALWFYPFDYRKDMEEWSWAQPDEQEVHHLLGMLRSLIVSSPSRQIHLQPVHCCSINCCGANCVMLLQDKDQAVNDVGNIPAKSRKVKNIFKCGSVCCIMEHQHNEQTVQIDGKSIPRAAELRNAGIKFKRCYGGIKKIKFDPNSATLYLPPIVIDDSTEILFRNLIAFEMCKLPFEIHYVACYVCLMDCLIDSEEDVALLRKLGIVTNYLGSDTEVAELFNGLCKGVTVNIEHAFAEQTQKVNEHYKNKFKVQFAELVKEHFSSPWKILALAVGTVLLFLTAVQTIFSILPVVKGK